MVSSGGLTIVPATRERFDDLATLVGSPNPEVPACWCLSNRVSTSEFNRLRGDERPERLRSLCAQTPPPGLLAYFGDTVAGWCSFGPRPTMERLLRSRTIPQLAPIGTWCIVCFVVAPSARRRGVAAALLDGVVDYARANGAPALEGYPIDTAGDRVSSAFAYVGTVPLFERAGFVRYGTTTAHSARLPCVIMRHDLGSRSDEQKDRR